MKFLQYKSRIEGLSDGVFAFAATLMVVNVGKDTELLSFKEEIPNFISFVASFFIMMVLW
ncbi:MAG: TMEM175 family protein [Polaribacter sp.]